MGFTEIEFIKKTIAADGSLISISDRSKFRVQSSGDVAKAILNNIRKRKFRTTLTGIGKLNAFMQSIMPDMVEKILIYSTEEIKKRS